MKYKFLVGLMLLFCSFLFLSFASISSASLISTFDNDVEGWSVVPGSGGSITYNSGYLEVSDTVSGSEVTISAPDKFLNSSWQGYNEGTLSFESWLIVDNNSDYGDWGSFGEVTLTKNNESKFVDLGNISDSGNTYSTHLTRENFGFSQNNWSALLMEGPDEITVNLEALGDVDEVVGFDNFKVAAPVPEPTTMLLFASGLFGVVGVGGRKYFKK